jgi:hypothetical protein
LDEPEPKPESKKRTSIDLNDSDDEDATEQPVIVDIKPENAEEADLLQKLSILPVMMRSVAQDYAYCIESQQLEPVRFNQDQDQDQDEPQELEPLIADSHQEITYAPVKKYNRHPIPEKDMKEVSRRLFSDGICNN